MVVAHQTSQLVFHDMGQNQLSGMQVTTSRLNRVDLFWIEFQSPVESSGMRFLIGTGTLERALHGKLLVRFIRVWRRKNIFRGKTRWTMAAVSWL